MRAARSYAEANPTSAPSELTEPERPSLRSSAAQYSTHEVSQYLMLRGATRLQLRKEEVSVIQMHMEHNTQMGRVRSRIHPE